MSDYDMSIHSNPDARVWAKFFMETWAGKDKNTIDEGDMIGWFANAMMAMHDHIKGLPVTVLPDGSAVFVASINAPASPAPSDHSAAPAPAPPCPPRETEA